MHTYIHHHAARVAGKRHETCITCRAHASSAHHQATNNKSILITQKYVYSENIHINLYPQYEYKIFEKYHVLYEIVYIIFLY